VCSDNNAIKLKCDSVYDRRMIYDISICFRLIN